MTLPNRPYIGNDIPNGPFSYPETPSTFDRLFGSLVPNIQLVVNHTDPGSASTEDSAEGTLVEAPEDEPDLVNLTVKIPSSETLAEPKEEAKWKFPKRPKKGQVFKAPDGTEWSYSQPREEDGTFSEDDLTTPAIESAFRWVPVTER